MEIAISMEIKATIVHEHTIEYYKELLLDDPETRKSFGLTVSYDMGGNNVLQVTFIIVYQVTLW